MNKDKRNSSINIVFVSTLFIAAITSISIIFPAFILGTIEDVPKYPEKIDIFEKGELFYQFLLVNMITISLAALHFKKKIPRVITNIFLKITSYDISRKQALVIMLILLDFYMVFTLQEVWMNDTWEDYNRIVKPRLQNFAFEDMIQPSGSTVSALLGKISMIVFGSYRVIPLVSSSILLFLTYFFTTIITKKQIPGIIAVSIVLSSTIFRTYDTTITYPNFWIMFYLLSLIAVCRFWPLSPFLFVAAIMSKPLPILFLPITFFFIYNSNIQQKKKIFISLSYVVLIAGIGLIYFLNNGITTKYHLYHNISHEFWSGFTTIAMQFRFDPLITLFLIPVIIGLFVVSKKEIKNTKLVMFLIVWMLLLAPIISGFTTYTNNTHRFIPLIIFFAVAVGVLFSTQSIGRSTVQRMDAVSPG